MLAAKKLSRNKLIAYLAVLFVLAVAAGGYLYLSDQAKQATPDPGADGSFDISNINSIGKTKFDLKGLEKFDIKLFNDQRFKSLSEFYNEVGIKSSIGRKNPFDPFKKASTTADKLDN
jgi:hypothetical protein